MFTRDTFEQCRQLIELSRECLNVMFRRNADTIQGTCNASIKYLLDFIELHFNPGLESVDVRLGFNQFTVGCFKFSSNALFAFCFNNFASLDQLLEVLATFLANLGVGAQAASQILRAYVFTSLSVEDSTSFFFFKITLAMVHLTRKQV